MFCIHCGTESTSSDRFCRSCGRELAAPAGSSSEHADSDPDPAAPLPAGGRPGSSWSGQATTGTSGPTTVPSRVRVGRTPPPDAGEIAGTGRRIGAFAIDFGFTMLGLLAVSIVVSLTFLAVSDATVEGDLTDAEAERLGIWIWMVAGGLLFFST